MAVQPVTPQRSGPSTPEAFIADREVFWGRFTRFIVLGVIVVAIVLIGLILFVY